MTDFIELTELWNNGSYNKIGEIIRREKWDQNRIVEFCSYFAKYVGLRELNILYKFL